MYPSIQLYINGRFVDADDRRVRVVVNPATESEIGKVPCATTRDLDEALATAQLALAKWRATSPLQRSDLLRAVARLTRERAEAIGRNITLDQGKPLAEAIAEVRSCAEHIEWHAEEGRRIYGRVVPPRRPGVRQLVVREPVGVCAAFTPWNFPFNQAIRKVAAALAAGCTLILKGPEESPSAIMAIAQMFHDAGLPPGVLNIVWGEPADISHYLIASPIVRKISFTGSVPVGKQLAALAGAHMKRTTMELGGHAPVLVFDDTDVEQAAEMLARYKVRNAGQTCISPSRFYVQERVYDRFVARFADVLASIKVGDGLGEGTEMGPLANSRRLAAMQSFVDDAGQHGGEVVTGGARIGSKGYFFAPTVVTGLPDDARLMVDEPFGPVSPIVPFHAIDDGLERANSLPYGLASYVFTDSLKTAARAADGLEAGMVNVNHFGMANAETPFGGIKDSGIGSEGGSETFDGYLVTKFITQI